MSLHEELAKDKIVRALEDKEELQKLKDHVYNLREKQALFERTDFQWFFQSFVQKPYLETRELHENCEDTNKSFILKGKVQAYKKIKNAGSTLTKEIKAIELIIHDAEIEPHKDAPNYKPEN